MILHSLQQHWPARKLEWMMVGLSLSWGAYAVFHPELFTQPATAAVLRQMVVMSSWLSPRPELVWGGGAILMGLVRFVALFINGAYVRSPMFRSVAAFGTMFIFTQVSIALYRSGVANWGLVIYPWLVGVDLMSSYRAAQDAVFAEAQRRSHRDKSGGASYLITR